MRLLSRAAAALAVTGLLAVPAGAQTKWEMPVPYPEGNFHTQNVLAFARDIAATTGGKLTIRVHPSGTLFKHHEIKQSIRRGLVPIGEMLASLASIESPVLGVDSVPFLTGSYADAKRLYEAQKPFLEKRLDGEGLKLLYSVPWPPQGLFARKEIRSIGDLSGVRLRTYNGATSRLSQLVKAVPVQIEAQDLPAAFRAGRVDAMFTSPATGVDSKAWDFLSHYHDLKGWQPRNIVFMNKAAFERLPADRQTAILTAAAAAEKRGWEVSEKEAERTTRVLVESKIAVVQPTDELRDALRKVGITMAEEWEKSAGADGTAVLKAYRGR